MPKPYKTVNNVDYVQMDNHNHVTGLGVGSFCKLLDSAYLINSGHANIYHVINNANIFLNYNGNYHKLIANSHSILFHANPNKASIYNVIIDVHFQLKHLYKYAKSVLDDTHVNWRTVDLGSLNVKNLDQRQTYQNIMWVSQSKYILKKYFN